MTIYSQIKEHAISGNDVYPFMFQPIIGRSNMVSSAIRRLKKEGVIVVAGKDGNGNPFYKKASPVNTKSPWYVK